MKRETLEMYDKIYSKMIKKAHDVIAASDISITKYKKAMKAVVAHASSLKEVFDLPNITIDIDWDPLRNEMWVTIDYFIGEMLATNVTQEKFTDLIKKSFELVYNDKFLEDIMGTDNYINIIEEGSLLFFRTMEQNEGVKTNTKEIRDFLKNQLGDIDI